MKYKKTIALVCVCFCILALAIIFFRGTVSAHDKNTVSINPNEAYPVTDVIDGDTFKADIHGKNITVRVLGINTPETVDPRKPVQCYGTEASDKAKKLLSGAHVKLESNPHRESRDTYGRYLLYVHLSDGTFYNEYMLQHGYAHEYTFNHEPYEKQIEFRKIEAEAKQNKVGLWGKCN